MSNKPIVRRSRQANVDNVYNNKSAFSVKNSSSVPLQQFLEEQRKKTIKLIQSAKQDIKIEPQGSKAQEIQKMFSLRTAKVSFYNTQQKKKEEQKEKEPLFVNYGRRQVLKNMPEIQSFESDTELSNFLGKLDKFNFEMYIAKTIHDHYNKGENFNSF